MKLYKLSTSTVLVHHPQKSTYNILGGNNTHLIHSNIIIELPRHIRVGNRTLFLTVQQHHGLMCVLIFSNTPFTSNHPCIFISDKKMYLLLQVQEGYLNCLWCISLINFLHFLSFIYTVFPYSFSLSWL